MTSLPTRPRRRASSRVRRRRTIVVAVAVLLLVVGSIWWLVGRDSPSPGAAPSPTPSPTSSPTSTPTPTSTGTSTPTASARPTSTAVATAGTGRLVTVPGDVAAPGRGPVTSVRVRVEEGVDVDRADFAAQVMATLNDPRSWGHGGRRTFARTDGGADVDVVLASPTTSARLCRPLQTFGKLSCRSGTQAVLTSYRWVKGTPEFPELSVYRQYVVNHEVGHVLGHGHERCPGAGRLAPVMQQQTKRVAPCRPNAWPYP